MAIATAFLAAALGALATDASPEWLAAFLAVAGISGTAAVAWASPRVRRLLPFARPFHVRCHDLWVQQAPLRLQMRRLRNEDVPDDLYDQFVSWDRRVWETVLTELPERGNVLEVDHGGRLEHRPQRLSRQDLDRHILGVRDMLARLIAEK
jgi:hypothetical protein